jgi:hypothetical protein
MIELVPEKIGEAVFLNVVGVCPLNHSHCRSCTDYGVAVHNWTLQNSLNYIILDFQDEKEICPVLINEVVQLRKRLDLPFYLVGLLDDNMKTIYDYNSGHDIFITPEEAVDDLRDKNPGIFSDISNIIDGEPMTISRSRHAARLTELLEGGSDNDEEEDEMHDF